ncbi:hypothetical protein M885DRAFT_10461 [Pelagophyceae sp. CCMP2097]|nr:hypothetical protein M885DRAFT_10461 [Pelagophyceae sp. CCMP2097]|mmetsp:Transcript_1288/g.3967  ORF Transcript_1288/g.3967 Transcript_1288/m.3967 type:complete len:371 (+) Transcript_1288:68-1180(+)
MRCLHFAACLLAAHGLVPVPRAGRSAKTRRQAEPESVPFEALMSQAAALRAEIAALEGPAAAAKTAADAAPAALSSAGAAELEAALRGGNLTTQTSFVSVLAAQKDCGRALRWDSVALVADGAEIPTEARVRAATGIDGAKDLFLGEEVTNDELVQLSAFVFISSGVLAIVAGKVVGGNAGAALMYGFAVVPLIFLGVGSSSPGILIALYLAASAFLKLGGASEAAERRRVHEAAHLIAGYSCGLAVSDFDVASVTFFDQQRAYSRDDVERLAAVAVAGAVAECERFGQAKGAQGDFILLQQLFDSCSPRLSAPEQQAATRRGVMNAYTILFGKQRARKDDRILRAVEAAMADKTTCDLPKLIALIEARD